MKKRIWIAALLAIGAAAPAQAHHRNGHRHHPIAAPLPDSVILQGKSYKVCKPGMEDDCVEPRDARLGHGHKPGSRDHRAKTVGQR